MKAKFTTKMMNFSTVLRTQSVQKITVELIDKIRAYQASLIDYSIYEKITQNENALIFDEIKSVEKWLKKHSQKLN